MKLPCEPALAFLAACVALPLVAVADTSRGTIREIDVAAGRITIEHAPIDGLGVSPTVFGVADRAMLDALEPGDGIEFVTVEEDGRFFVTEIRTVP